MHPAGRLRGLGKGLGKAVLCCWGDQALLLLMGNAGILLGALHLQLGRVRWALWVKQLCPQNLPFWPCGEGAIPHSPLLSPAPELEVNPHPLKCKEHRAGTLRHK